MRPAFVVIPCINDRHAFNVSKIERIVEYTEKNYVHIDCDDGDSFVTQMTFDEVMNLVNEAIRSATIFAGPGVENGRDES